MVLTNKLIRMTAAAGIVATVTGCGTIEKIYDQENYESLTNECGELVLLSGGEVYKEVNAKIIYSDSDSQAIWYSDLSNGEEHYWQGDAGFHKMTCSELKAKYN